MGFDLRNLGMMRKVQQNTSIVSFKWFFNRVVLVHSFNSQFPLRVILTFNTNRTEQFRLSKEYVELGFKANYNKHIEHKFLFTRVERSLLLVTVLDIRVMSITLATSTCMVTILKRFRKLSPFRHELIWECLNWNRTSFIFCLEG